MSYIRFKRLQKFINGLPVDEYMKSSERYDLIAYDSYFSCSSGYAELTRWVDTPIVECYNNNLCSTQKQQVSYDNGSTWSDTGVIQIKDIIEANARECLAYLEEWRVIQGEYTCENFNKYAIEEEYISYDSGQSWEPTGQTRIGQMIEPLSTDCNVLYQWVTVPNEFICDGYDKYTLQKEQYSLDDGTTWIDTGNERAGTLIETESEDCGYEPSYIYQWIVVQGEFVCQGTDKYQKEKEQRSADGGQTWEDTGNVRAGSLIERQSYDCGYISYRWIVDPTTYECINYDKYSVEKEQQTSDGETWTDTGRTRTGSLIEHDSTDCGYIPPIPTNIKARLTYLNGDTYDIPLNGSSTLTQAEIRRGISDTTDSHYYDNIRSVVITDNVTIIDEYAFQFCENILSINLPSTLTEIKRGGFISCTSVTTIVVPNSVLTLGASAFQSCHALTNITLPTGITSIPDSLLKLCISLRTVTLPSGVTSIGNDSFMSCSNLENINIPSMVTTIGSNAFNECRKLSSITLPNVLTTINSYAFYNCKMLTEIFIPSSVINIYKYAFAGCSALTSITCESTTPAALELNEVTHNANEFDNTNNCPIYVPCSSVQTYKSASGWSYYQNRIQASTEPIYQWVVVSGEYVCVGVDKYEKEKEQSSINCGSTWTDTGNTRAGTLIERRSIDCGYIPPTYKARLTYLNGDTYDVPLNGSSILTLSEIPNYQSDITSVVITEAVTVIGNYSFQSRFNITSVIIPDSVITIEYNAFEYCTSLTNIVIPDSVTTIEESAFALCDNLTNVTIGNGVTSIGQYAFQRNPSLTNIVIPDSVTGIGNSAFQYCTGLTSVTIGNSVTSIGGSAFYSSSNLTSVTCLPTTPPTLGNTSVFNRTCTIYVPAESVETYKSDTTPWFNYRNQIQAIP